MRNQFKYKVIEQTITRTLVKITYDYKNKHNLFHCIMDELFLYKVQSIMKDSPQRSMIP